MVFQQPNPFQMSIFRNVAFGLKLNGFAGNIPEKVEQAKRFADQTAFLYVDMTKGGSTGYLVEFGATKQIFEYPQEKPTQDYIAGAFS